MSGVNSTGLDIASAINKGQTAAKDAFASLVPSGSGGGSIAAVIGVIVAVAGAAWYFVFRPKKGARTPRKRR
jgi:hypothetical protein